jgi:hypothetical protein
MSTKQVREIQIRVTGKYEAGETFRQAQNDMQRTIPRTKNAYGVGALPSRINRYSPSEQADRNTLAGLYRDVRAGRGGPALGSYETNIGRVSNRNPYVGEGSTRRGGLAGIADDACGLRRMMNMGGALVIADQVGRALQRIPDVAKQFEEHLKYGGTRTEAFAQAMAETLPGVGELAKGFQAVGSWLKDSVGEGSIVDQLTGWGTDAAKARRKADADETAKMRADMTRRRDEERKPIIEGGRRAAQEAADMNRLTGLRGTALETAQAQLEYEQELREIDKLGAGKGKLNTEQQDQLKAQLDARREAAERKRNDRLKQIAEQEHERIMQAETEHGQRMQALRDEQEQKRLQADGRQREARIAAVQADAKKEQQAAAERFNQSMKAAGEEADPVKRQMAEADAQRRWAEERVAIERGSAAEIARINDEANKAKLQKEQEHADAMGQIKTSAAAQALRNAGKDAQAERMELDAQFERTLREISQRAERDAGADKENAGAIRQRASEEAQAAAGEYATSLEALKQREQEDARRFAQKSIKTVEGSNHLLTGVVGLRGPEVKAATDTAKSTAQAAKHLEAMGKDIAALLALLAKGGVLAPMPATGA